MMFYVGQRVVAVSAPDYNDYLVGHSGEIVEIVPGTGLTILVVFDTYEEDYEWWCEETSLVPLFTGPPLPVHIVVERKCKRLWNSSNFVYSHGKLAY